MVDPSDAAGVATASSIGDPTPSTRPGNHSGDLHVGGSTAAGSTAGSPAPSAAASSAPRSDGDLVRLALEQARGRGKRSRTQPLPEDAFPGYKILRELHRGGQGVVYQCIQNSTRRKVAIKVMREGPFSGPKEIVRFEREIEILSALNHPNIVAIQDSGITLIPGGGPGNGLPFFVMDYVSGQSLGSWAADSTRKSEEILTLFTKICEAVNAAHLRGVIHRDLKPGNIRVDASGEPHILDFGLAKSGLNDSGIGTSLGSSIIPPSGSGNGLIAGPDGGSAVTSDSVPRTGSRRGRRPPGVMTLTGQFLGSLQWASPEQAEGNLSAIDVRTDVYSLGVVLYQLLTGTFPYPVTGTNREILDTIVKVPATRPSTIISPTRDRVNDEVETIVLKCLSKERERRYQNAGEIARDLRRYAAGEPIEAKRDSGWYILRKHLRRHQVPVAAAALVAVTVLGAGVVSTVFWRSAEHNFREARTAEAGAVATAEVARVAEAAAVREKQRTQRSLEFLESMLNLIDPDVSKGSDTTVVQDMLRDAGAVVENRLGQDPDLAAAMHDTIGTTYLKIGKYQPADQHLSAALAWRTANLGPNDRLTAQSLLRHAELLNELKAPPELEKARAQAAAALATFTRLDGSRSESAAQCLDAVGYSWKQQDRFAEAETNYNAALAMRQTLGPPDAPGIAETLANLGEMFFEQRRTDEAVSAMDRSLAIRVRHAADRPTAVATASQSLASFLAERGRPDDIARAGRLFHEALAILKPLVDEGHPYLAATRNKYALYIHHSLHDPAAAETEFVTVLIARRARLGDASPLVAVSRMNLSSALRDQGKFADARTLLEATFASLDPSDRYVGIARCKFVELSCAEAHSLAGNGNRDEAIAALLRGQTLFLDTIAGNTNVSLRHSETATTALWKGLAEVGRNTDAEATLKTNYQRFAQSKGPSDPRTKLAARCLAEFYTQIGEPAKRAEFDGIGQ